LAATFFVTFANPGTAVSGNALSGSGPGDFVIEPVNYQVIFDQGGSTPTNSLGLAVGQLNQNEKFHLSASATSNPVPEGSSMLLLGSGLCSIAGFKRRWFTDKLVVLLHT
jgi:hypothetical protein